MGKAAHEVFDEALALSEEDRGKLAEKLVESLDASVDPDAEEAWTAEIERRLAKIEAGQTKSISMSEAVARLHRAAHER
jgi:putative addiction module component (TIGR02574 family)